VNVMNVRDCEKKKEKNIVRVVVVPGLAWNDRVQMAADSSQQLQELVSCVSQAMACNELLSEQVLLRRVRQAVALQVSENEGKKNSENEYSENEEYVSFLHDSGSNANLSNIKTVFVKGSLKKCDVNVFGINEDDSIQAMHASWRGDVVYKVNENESVVLKNVLYVPDAMIGESTVYEPTVLISTSKMVNECNVGVSFVDGEGGEVEFVRDRKIIGKFKSSSMNGLYVDKRRMKSERERLICECIRILKMQSDRVRENEKERERFFFFLISTRRWIMRDNHYALGL